MNRLTKQETISQINAFGASGTSFLFLISFSGEGNLVLEPDEAADSGLFIDFPGFRNHHFERETTKGLLFAKEPVKKEQYRKAFMKVMTHLRYGNTFLLNLTFPTTVRTNLKLREIFSRSRAAFRLLLKDELVIFSPERFVRIEGTTITANPMKGTMDARLSGASQMLLADPKEDAEHHTIVDLIRNDLSSIASQVSVKRFKYIDSLRTHRGELLQMSSEITGRLSSSYQRNLGEILFTILPAGSICGAPKKKTLEIIHEVEDYDRGYYTGIFGYFDGRLLDSAVAIRYMEKMGNGMIFKSGGGITYQSNWEREYEEMQNKVYVPVY